MEQYGASHLVVLVLFVAGLGPAYVLGRRLRPADSPAAVRTGRALGAAVATVGLASTVTDLTLRFELGVSLPLQLSDLAWVVTAAALWTRHPTLAAVGWLWSLTVVMQAVLTPSLGEDVPDPRFFAYWFLHVMDVWAAVFLVWGLRLRPTWHRYRVAVLVTLGWAVSVMTFNSLAGTNYGYLQRKPRGGSVLDLLGPWPAYVVAEVVILLVVWALMTWPWERAAAGGRGGQRSTSISPSA